MLHTYIYIFTHNSYKNRAAAIIKSSILQIRGYTVRVVYAHIEQESIVTLALGLDHSVIKIGGQWMSRNILVMLIRAHMHIFGR